MSCSGVKAFIRPLEYPIGKPKKNIEAKDANLKLAIEKYNSNKSISQCDRMALHYLELRVIGANCGYDKHNKLKIDKILSKHGLFNIEKKCNYKFVSDKKLRRELVPHDLLNASAPMQDDCELFNKQVLEFTRKY